METVLDAHLDAVHAQIRTHVHFANSSITLLAEDADHALRDAPPAPSRQESATHVVPAYQNTT